MRRVPLLLLAILGSIVAIPAMAQAPTPSSTQTPATVKVTRRAIVHEDARGDSVVLGAVDAGSELKVIGRRASWYRVTAPAGAEWKTGWIQISEPQPLAVSAPATLARTPTPTAPRRRLIRGFGQTGGTLFMAKDSFKTILGHGFGVALGGGGQVVFRNGAFVEGGAERFRKTGSRVLVSGTKIFTLEVPDTVTLVPIEMTVGYRDFRSRTAHPYVGFGLGWHLLSEDSPSLAGQAGMTGHLGYHLVGGVEVPMHSWLALAGEARVAWVPKAFGANGVAGVFDEHDLGGTAFRFKLIVGY